MVSSLACLLALFGSDACPIPAPRDEIHDNREPLRFACRQLTPCSETVSEIKEPPPGARSRNTLQKMCSLVCLVGRWRREMKSLSADCLGLRHDLLRVAFLERAGGLFSLLPSGHLQSAAPPRIGIPTLVLTKVCQARGGIQLAGRLRREFQ